MQFDLGLALVQPDPALLPVGAIVALALAAAAVGLLCRRRLLPGIGKGMLVAGLSGAALLAFAADAEGRSAQVAAGHALTGLTILWYAISRVSATRGSAQARRPTIGGEGADAGGGRCLFGCAALVCGLAALANLVASEAVGLAQWSVATSDFVVLLLLAMLVWVLDYGAWRAYPAVGLLVCVMFLAVPPGTLMAYTPGLGLAMNAAGLLSLLAVIGLGLRRWRRRRRRWLEDPRRLTETAPPSAVVSGLFVGVSLLVGVAGIPLHQAPLTPTAVLLAGLTCLIVGHLHVWISVGELGLGLVAESIVTATLAWARPDWTGGLLGLTVAGLYVLWLARFWHQQLQDGRAWTTAGSLIRSARRLAYVLWTGAFGLAGTASAAEEPGTQPLFISVLTLIVLLLAIGLLVRDSHEHHQPVAACLACLMGLLAVGYASHVVYAETGASVRTVVILAGGALLVALRAVATPSRQPVAKVYAACLGGALPVGMLLLFSLRGFGFQGWVGLVVAILAILVAVMSLGAGAPATAAQQPPRT